MTPYILKSDKFMFRKAKKAIALLILVAFFSTSVKNPAYAQVADEGILRLPAPGVLVHLSPGFNPAHLQGITIHPDNALQFDFLINKGDQVLDADQKKVEYKKLVKYFLASLTIPDEDQWVNLSPYEKNRIIKEDFGKTEMGRDLLAEDYMLKQITSSLIYPDSGLGKKFWDKVYTRAWNEYHTTSIPVNTFNKVWIVPDQAMVYESGNSAYILKSHLKVMLEEDYLSLAKHTGLSSPNNSTMSSPNAFVGDLQRNKEVNTIGSQVIREIVLPALEEEVNQGKNFATLRQMYSGMVLATWYKRALKESLLGKIYADKAKVQGVTGFIDSNPSVIASKAKQSQEQVYQQYLRAFKKGVFNYIKEDVDKYTKETIPRKYFSGGFNRATAAKALQIVHFADLNPAMGITAPNSDLDNATVSVNTVTEAPSSVVAKPGYGSLRGNVGAAMTKTKPTVIIFQVNLQNVDMNLKYWQSEFDEKFGKGMVDVVTVDKHSDADQMLKDRNVILGIVDDQDYQGKPIPGLVTSWVDYLENKRAGITFPLRGFSLIAGYSERSSEEFRVYLKGWGNLENIKDLSDRDLSYELYLRVMASSAKYTVMEPEVAKRAAFQVFSNLEVLVKDQESPELIALRARFNAIQVKGDIKSFRKAAILFFSERINVEEQKNIRLLNQFRSCLDDLNDAYDVKFLKKAAVNAFFRLFPYINATRDLRLTLEGINSRSTLDEAKKAIDTGVATTKRTTGLRNLRRFNYDLQLILEGLKDAFDRFETRKRLEEEASKAMTTGKPTVVILGMRGVERLEDWKGAARRRFGFGEINVLGASDFIQAEVILNGLNGNTGLVVAFQSNDKLDWISFLRDNRQNPLMGLNHCPIYVSGHEISQRVNDQLALGTDHVLNPNFSVADLLKKEKKAITIRRMPGVKAQILSVVEAKERAKQSLEVLSTVSTSITPKLFKELEGVRGKADVEEFRRVILIIKSARVPIENLEPMLSSLDALAAAYTAEGNATVPAKRIVNKNEEPVVGEDGSIQLKADTGKWTFSLSKQEEGQEVVVTRFVIEAVKGQYILRQIKADREEVRNYGRIQNMTTILDETEQNNALGYLSVDSGGRFSFESSEGNNFKVALVASKAMIGVANKPTATVERYEDTGVSTIQLSKGHSSWTFKVSDKDGGKDIMRFVIDYTGRSFVLRQLSLEGTVMRIGEKFDMMQSIFAGQDNKDYLGDLYNRGNGEFSFEPNEGRNLIVTFEASKAMMVDLSALRGSVQSDTVKQVSFVRSEGENEEFRAERTIVFSGGATLTGVRREEHGPTNWDFQYNGGTIFHADFSEPGTDIDDKNNPGPILAAIMEKQYPSLEFTINNQEWLYVSQAHSGNAAMNVVAVENRRRLFVHVSEEKIKALESSLNKFLGDPWNYSFNVVLSTSPSLEENKGFNILPAGGENGPSERKTVYITISSHVDASSMMDELVKIKTEDGKKRLNEALIPAIERIKKFPWAKPEEEVNKEVVDIALKSSMNIGSVETVIHAIEDKTGKDFISDNAWGQEIKGVKVVLKKLFERLNNGVSYDDALKKGRGSYRFIDISKGVPNLNIPSVLEKISLMGWEEKKRSPKSDYYTSSRNMKRSKYANTYGRLGILAAIAALIGGGWLFEEPILDRKPVDRIHKTQDNNLEAIQGSGRVEVMQDKIGFVIAGPGHQIMIGDSDSGHLRQIEDKIINLDAKSQSPLVVSFFYVGETEEIASKFQGVLNSRGIRNVPHPIHLDAEPFDLVTGWNGKVYKAFAFSHALLGHSLRVQHSYTIMPDGDLLQDKVPHINLNLAQPPHHTAVLTNHASIMNQHPNWTKGGIDFNGGNLNLEIKRDGRGVPLPVSQQDMAQLSRIQGFEAEILDIEPATNIPILRELQQRLQPSSV